MRHAYLMATLVDVLFELGDFPAALPLCRGVLELETANKGGDAAVAMAESQLGRSLLLLADFSAAQQHLTRALALRAQTYPDAKSDRLADAWRELLDRARGRGEPPADRPMRGGGG